MPGKAHAMRFRFESHMSRVCRNNREEPKKRGSSLLLKRHTHSAYVLRPMGKGRKGKWPLRTGRGTLRRRRAPAENPLSLTEVIPPRAAGIPDRPRKAPPPGEPTPKPTPQTHLQNRPSNRPPNRPSNRPSNRPPKSPSKTFSKSHVLTRGSARGRKGALQAGAFVV